MKLYFDKENLLSFLNQERTEGTSYELHEEIMRLIRRQLHLVFNFDKRDAIANPRIKACLDTLSRGRSENESVDEFSTPPFPERPIKSNFRQINLGTYFARLFLLMTKSRIFEAGEEYAYWAM